MIRDLVIQCLEVRPADEIAADMPTTVFATVLGIPVASILKLYLAATFERHEHKWLAN